MASSETSPPKMKITYFKDNLEFIQNKADTPGMSMGYGKYSLGIKLDKEITKEIGKVVKKHKTENPIRGNGLLYLKEANISKKQKDEILSCGPMTVKVKFQITGVCENLDNNTNER